MRRGRAILRLEPRPRPGALAQDVARRAWSFKEPRACPGGSTHGYTLIEIMVASLLASIIAGGTMMSLVALGKMSSGKQDRMANAEAANFAQETVEKFRDEVDTNSSWLANQAALPPPGWQSDPLPGGSATESKLNAGAKRCYRVRLADCDGVGGAGDCYAVQSQVCWANMSGCLCP